MTAWTETDAERYHEMMGVVPPIFVGLGFLVGEPTMHRVCRVKDALRATYDAFVEIDGRFYVATESLTLPEFRAVTREQVLGAAT